MANLFPPDFIAAISRLRLNAGQVSRGGRHAEHGSVQMGAGMEFRDFRPYLPGDDIRHVDWGLYRRSGKLFQRMFEEERDLPVYILLDCSDSMFFGDAPRADAAKQAAAALIGAALNQSDQPALFPFGESLNEGFPSISSARALPSILSRLERIGAAGQTNLPAVLHRFNSLRQRKGLVCIISDFFDPAGLQALADGMSSLQHKLLLIQLCRESDAEPDLDGELSLADCETGEEFQVSITPKTIDAYRRAYKHFQQELLEFSRKRRAGYITLNADADVLEQFMEIFAGATITTSG